MRVTVPIAQPVATLTAEVIEAHVIRAATVDAARHVVVNVVEVSPYSADPEITIVEADVDVLE